MNSHISSFFESILFFRNYRLQFICLAKINFKNSIYLKNNILNIILKNIIFSHNFENMLWKNNIRNSILKFIFEKNIWILPMFNWNQKWISWRFQHTTSKLQIHSVVHLLSYAKKSIRVTIRYKTTPNGFKNRSSKL